LAVQLERLGPHARGRKEAKLEIRERLALRIPDAVAVSGLGQTTLYDAMQAGELAFVKVGARRLIMAADLLAFLERHRVGEAA